MKQIGPVAALVAALAGVAVAGCGQQHDRGSAPAAARGPRVVLDLKGGGNDQATACGAHHHYTSFAHAGQIRFGGTVAPLPAVRWKVKVKLKVCRGHVFQDLLKVDTAEDKHRGSFTGSTAAPKPGRYFARASLYENGRLVARSDKEYFDVK
jgi:hypothetical protein